MDSFRSVLGLWLFAILTFFLVFAGGFRRAARGRRDRYIGVGKGRGHLSRAPLAVDEAVEATEVLALVFGRSKGGRVETDLELRTAGGFVDGVVEVDSVSCPSTVSERLIVLWMEVFSLEEVELAS